MALDDRPDGRDDVVLEPPGEDRSRAGQIARLSEPSNPYVVEGHTES
jgi:hypothetical protein